MNVFCALITMIGSSGRSFLMRGRMSKAFSSGITTSVMTRSPSPSADPAPQGRGVAGDAHLIAGPRQRLVQHGADGGVVVGDENVSAA